MSWHYLQGLEEVSSEAICWDGERFAPSSLTSTLNGYCLPDSETESCRDSQSGMMCKPLMESLGEAASMLSAEDSLAKTFPPRVKARESLARDQGCGPKWRGSLVKLSQDGSWWKIHPFSLLADSEPFCGTWPKWGTMRNGECLERIALASAIKGTASGLWPSPRKSNPGSRPNGKGGKVLSEEVAISIGLKMRGEYKKTGIQLNPAWVEWLMGWPIGWTDLQELGMDKYQEWLLVHSQS